MTQCGGETGRGHLSGDGVADVLRSVGEAIYVWDPATDVIRWGGDEMAVLRVPHDTICDNRSFAAHLDSGNLVSRYDTVMGSSERDMGDGVAYQIQYGFLPDPDRPESRIWVEDIGRWFADANGRPVRVHGVIRAIDARYEREQRLAHLSRYDELTGQMNRTCLIETMGDAIRNTKRYSTSGGFILAAIDNLSHVNATFGFDVADQLIAGVAGRLKTEMRGGDMIGRYSGNKFGIVLHQCSDEEIEIAARRLRAAVSSEVVETAAGPVSATVSMGGVIFPRHGNTASDAFMRAQEALDDAKLAGRDSFTMFRVSRERESARRANLKIADDIVRALNGHHLALALQPIVDAKTGVPNFYEGLLRIRNDDGELESAGRLIPAAERLGLMNLIDRRTLDLAVAVMAERPDIHMSLNVSAVAAEDTNWIAALLAHERMLPGLCKRLIIEITETAAIEDLDKTQRFVRKVREAGCRIAMDDFGAGYTSFRNLRMLDIDILKIDGSYGVGVATSADDRMFIQVLVDLARNLGVTTVAEWIETEEAATILSGMGIDYFQGFYFGKPEIVQPASTASRAA